ncbi:MAG: endolytic transglycosylase MltG [Candidatus Krumholzibacteria bacterium]|nr:endolytic transglycosylase MltG [Candidatus Krumholzibacteria bacterium]MDP6796659.1 endolytic transglycosylase MltG [Candidatus Krumholzibacteria bacterium]MDP7021287.1 endolytic transglycosylase MltG [Candidatus Krumholzibacteria bacterium]
MSTSKTHRPLLLLLLLLILDLLFAIWVSWALPSQDSVSEELVLIPEGWTSGEITDSLLARGVLRNDRLFRVALYLGGGRDLKAGRYLFRRPEAPGRVLSALKRGETERVWLRIPEGLWLKETAGVVASQLGLDSLSLHSRFLDTPPPVGDSGAGGSGMEGFLFPDTYAFEYPVREKTVVRRLRERSEEVIGELEKQYPERARELGRWNWVTLASIVEAETRLDTERERVAAVYLNRLRKGMKLEADPTIIYGLGRRLRRLYYKHLDIEGPYNTYQNPGLPLTPICNPGYRSLEAVLKADLSDPSLYFVARGDGSHLFSETYREHQSKVQDLRNGRIPHR